MKEKSDTELADKDLLQILEIEDNNICNDCGKKDPRWCSINNAVLLCSSCARTHKKFNEKISKIKSLEVDPWTKEEIFFLKLGGNRKFTDLIKSYNIPLTKENQEYKYYTKAAEYHRNFLLEQSKNNNINNIIKPSLKEGIEILYKDEYSNLFNKYSNQQNVSDNLNQINNDINNNIINNNSSQINNDNSNSSWVNKIIDKIAPDIDDRQVNNINNNENKTKNFFDNIANNMLYAINDVKERAKDIDFKEKFKIAGEYVQNQTEKIQNSDTFKGIMNSVSTGIDTIIQKTDQFFKPDNKSNINQINQTQNIYQQNIPNNLQLNSINIQNNLQNQNININSNSIGNIVNNINEPKFKSNYSSINNEKNEQYNNYIKFNENNNDNINNNLNKDNKETEINKEENKQSQNIAEINENNNKNDNNENLDNVENNEKNKNDDNIESLDNVEDNNPNLLIMSNTPNYN